MARARRRRTIRRSSFAATRSPPSGSSARVGRPAGALVIDASGKTVIPGIIGLHDHMYYGGMKFMGASYPRLFLSAGVTTIRTTGSVDAYQELNLKRKTDSMTDRGADDRADGSVSAGAGTAGLPQCIRSRVRMMRAAW